MASEKTPNLGLNQIDRTSPKTTYFDLEKYLDQNWRAVDNFAGDVNDGVDAIKKRLDTTERKAVTLEPGVQIVHAEKAAPFSLTGLSGRTLVNLLGRWGSMESVVNVGVYKAILTKDATSKTQGASSIKVTIDSGQLGAAGFYSNFSWKAGKFYVAIADVKNGNAERAYLSSPGYVQGNYITDTHGFSTSWFKFAPSVDSVNNIDLAVMGTESQYAYFDAVRIYEISAADYTALANMTAEQVATKYPYVDSVMPVRNSYAIRYGENLLPSFYGWSAKQGTPTIVDGKSVAVTVDNKIVHTISPLVPGQKYTVSVQSGGATGRITVTDEPESAIIVEAMGSGLLSATFTATSRAANIRLLGTTSTAVTMSKPMLNIGSTAKPFKPREDSMLALQTYLYADPVTGANADTVFEHDGQYFKNKNWQGVALDGSLPWALYESATGYKTVRLPNTDGLTNSERLTKFDGKVIQHAFPVGASDQSYLSSSSATIGLTIATADSGWGDAYTPTADEIKAYFMGWKMRNQTTLDPYDGTGVKAWGTVLSGGANNYTNTLPTTQATDYKTPYQLVYQLTTPTVEPIVSEGQLTFNEGDNQVEVGTGIVLRERATYADNGAGANVFNAAASAFKFRAEKVLAIYEDGHILPSAILGQRSPTYVPLLGTGFASITPQETRLDRAYSATYLLFDRSPVVPFTGSYAANEKSLLADLVDSVQQNTARVSVLENKKAEKDSPAWVKPTLINGWSSSLFSYLKMSDGLVLFRDSISGGAVAPGTLLFTLPKGYRPGKLTEIRVRSSNGGGVESNNATIMVDALGQVKTQNTTYMTIWLDGISFLAEQ
ncbi:MULTISPECIES: hypothetical protein [unclassified Paenibacillus]|uniref:hypothetical protein n=1 Tax=unclassified Paenibacillus TaxID=185978 RepID=UPI0038363B67